MSYNGIGLTTARGSATNGFVQRNSAAVRAQNSSGRYERRHQLELEANKAERRFDRRNISDRQVDRGILEHEQKRNIEVKCFELRESLEEQGVENAELSEAEIDRRVDELRHKLLEELKSTKEASAPKRIESHRVHEIADAKITANRRMKEALDSRRAPRGLRRPRRRDDSRSRSPSPAYRRKSRSQTPSPSRDRSYSRSRSPARGHRRPYSRSRSPVRRNRSRSNDRASSYSRSPDRDRRRRRSDSGSRSPVRPVRLERRSRSASRSPSRTRSPPRRVHLSRHASDRSRSRSRSPISSGEPRSIRDSRKLPADDSKRGRAPSRSPSPHRTSHRSRSPGRPTPPIDPRSSRMRQY